MGVVPSSARFRYKFSRKCNGSDLQRAANWPEAVMIRCQQLMQEWRANRRRRNIIQLTRTWRGLPSTIDAVISSRKPKCRNRCVCCRISLSELQLANMRKKKNERVWIFYSISQKQQLSSSCSKKIQRYRFTRLSDIWLFMRT